jgi:hypothetical protein
MSVKVNDPMFSAKLFMTFGPINNKYMHSAQEITTVQAYILENQGLFETINNDIINLILIMNSNPTVRENTNNLFQLTTSGEPPNSEKFNSAVEKFKTLETIFPKSDFDATNAPELNPNGIIQIVAPKLNLTESQMNNINNIVEGRPQQSSPPPTPPPSPRMRTPGQAYMGTKASNAKILPPTTRNPLPRITPNALLPTTPPNVLPPTPPPLNIQKGGFEPFTLMFICLGAMNATCKLTGMKNGVCSGVSNAFNGILDVTLSCLGGVAGAFFGGGRKKSRRRQNKSKQRRQNKSRRRRQK